MRNKTCNICADCSFPDHLRYTTTHTWTRLEQGVFTVGVTRIAIHRIQDIIIVDLPQQGDAFAAQQSFGTIEAASTYAQILAPLEGMVVQVNEDLDEQPELVLHQPYSGGWLVKMKASPAQYGSLLDDQAYSRLVSLAA